MGGKLPTFSRVREILSRPWVGPSISLVVLTVSVSALTISLLTFHRQGNRWALEDERIGPEVYLLLEKPRPDSWRRGVLQVSNRLDRDLIIDSVAIIDPSGVELTTEDRAPTGETSPAQRGKPTDHIDFKQTIRRRVPPSLSNNWGAAFYVRGKRLGNHLMMRFVLHEVPYPHRDWTRDSEAAVTP
jgi:hypothetical protein